MGSRGTPSGQSDSVHAVQPEAHVVSEIETVLEVLQEARRTVEEAAGRLRERDAEKLALEAVTYTRDELAAAEKRLVQRTMYVAQQLELAS